MLVKYRMSLKLALGKEINEDSLPHFLWKFLKCIIYWFALLDEIVQKLQTHSAVSCSAFPHTQVILNILIGRNMKFYAKMIPVDASVHHQAKQASTCCTINCVAESLLRRLQPW